MHTVTQRDDNARPPDHATPSDHATPYFRARATRFDRWAARFAAEFGLPSDPP